MQTKYRTTIDHLHDYLCSNPQHPIVQIHHSHIDHQKLFRSRLVSWLYITFIYIWVIWEMGSITTNFIYLTLQGYFITWLFYTAVLQDYWLTKIYGYSFLIYHRFKYYIEIIYEIALCFEVPITFVFWGFLFQILLRNGASAEQIFVNTNLHLGPFMCLLVELYYNNFSFPKKHFWIAVFYGTAYLLINLVYSISVKVIYEPIDWKSVLSYCIVIGCYAITFGAHHFGGFAYRKWKAHKLTNRITEGLIKQIEPNNRSTEPSIRSTEYIQRRINFSINKQDVQISDSVNEGQKKQKPTKDNQVLL